LENIDICKVRIQQLTRRTCGCSCADVVEALRGYVLDWKTYFLLTERPWAFRELDG
jgi:hypothetical protein